MNDQSLRLSPKLAMVNLNYPKNIGTVGPRSAGGGGSGVVVTRQASASARITLSKLGSDATLTQTPAHLRNYDVNAASAAATSQPTRYASPYETPDVITVRPYSSHQSVTSPLGHHHHHHHHHQSSHNGVVVSGGSTPGGSVSSGGGTGVNGRLFMNALSAKSLPAFASASTVSCLNAASIYGRPMSKRHSARPRE